MAHEFPGSDKYGGPPRFRYMARRECEECAERLDFWERWEYSEYRSSDMMGTTDLLDSVSLEKPGASATATCQTTAHQCTSVSYSFIKPSLPAMTCSLYYLHAMFSSTCNLCYPHTMPTMPYNLSYPSLLQSPIWPVTFLTVMQSDL